MNIINKIFNYERFDKNFLIRTITSEIDILKKNNEDISYSCLRLIRVTNNLLDSEKRMFDIYYKK